MASKVNIVVSDSNYISALGRYGPIVEPTRMEFKTALWIINEGNHDVKIEVPSGMLVDLDVDKVKKMIKRGDEGVKELWEEVQLESQIAKEESENNEEDTELDDGDSEEETKEEVTKKPQKKYSPFTPKKDEKEESDSDEDDPTVFKG